MKGTARHLQRALQQASAPLRESQALPPDTLTRQSMAIRQAGGTGFPASADSLAYDSSQSLLVVGAAQMAAHGQWGIRGLGDVGWRVGLRAYAAGSEAHPPDDSLINLNSPILITGGHQRRQDQADRGPGCGSCPANAVAVSHLLPGFPGQQGRHPPRHPGRVTSDPPCSGCALLWHLTPLWCICVILVLTFAIHPLQLGDIQLFSIDSFKLVASTWLQGDAITAVTPLPSAPYLLIGG